MATLSSTDKQNLNADQQKQVLALKQQYETAKAGGATSDELNAIHKQAEDIRANAASGAYSGGVAGNSYEKPAQNSAEKISAYTDTYATNNYANGGGNPYMSAAPANGYTNLSQADSALLNAEQQKQIAALKAAWSAAATQEERDEIHALAEGIRANASGGGYTGGANGAGYSILGANAGGMTADQMAKWLEDYQATNYQKGTGWTNGYSTAMNVRSKANKIRQQMLANEQAMASADQNTKDYLHQQNLALSQLLYQYTSQSEKNTWYNDELGRWETINGNVGYGYNVTGSLPGVSDSWKKHYGYTDDDIARYANDTSHYYNFVDTGVPYRNRVDESSGYTGQYAQFVNGPYMQLLGGGTHDGSVNPSIYQNMPGDGFYDNGNYDLGAPDLKGNNAMSDYTNQFTSYVQGGVIQPGILAVRNPGASGDAAGAYSHKVNGVAYASDPRYTGGINRDVAASTPEDPNNLAGQIAYYKNYGQYGNAYGGGGRASMPSAGGGGYEDYINQMYAEALNSQMAQLESSYKQNVSDLDASSGKVDDTYTEQKRQTTGTNAQNAAAWREMANAYGLNSGAIGQAALAQNNQLQSNLNTLESAQAAAQADIERQRVLLGQQYQLAIQQALSENNFNKAQTLYQEAVRQDEKLMQQQQFAANLALQYAQMAMQQSQFQQGLALDYAKAGLTTSGTPVTASLDAPTLEAPVYDEELYISATPAQENAAYDLEQRLGTMTGLSREQKYSVIEDAVLRDQITSEQGRKIAQLYGFI